MDTEARARSTSSGAGRSESEREVLRRTAELLATILDAAVVIPGTSIRIGLDPLIGLIPGLGDTIANLVGSTILLLAARLRIPRIVLIRMSANIFLNGVVGSVPVFGDLFSFWFRSNVRNAELLRRHSQVGTGVTTTGDWLFVIGLALITLSAMVGVIVAVFQAARWLWNFLEG